MKFRDLFALVIWFSTLAFFYLFLTNHLPNNQYTGMIIGNLITIDSLVIQFYFRKKPQGEKP